MTDRLLVLVRHGQSEWNLKNLFTGWKDVGLTDQGINEASRAGRLLAEAGFHFGVAFTSTLGRASHTLDLMKRELGIEDVETIRSAALNERDYGDLTGLNKDEARVKWGDEQVHKWRRSYSIAPPGGESLRDTGARVWPYYIHTMLPHVMRGEGVLVSAHGNSLRALMMALEGMTPEQIVERELATGVPVVYRFAADASLIESTVIDDSATAALSAQRSRPPSRASRAS